MAQDWDDPAVRNQLSQDALNGSTVSDDVPFGDVDDGRGWTQSQFEAFSLTGI